MRRGHVSEAAIRNAVKQICPHTILIDWNGVERSSNSLEHLACCKVARVLDDNRIARIEDDARAKIQCLLGAVHDDDLVGIAADTPRSCEIALQRFLEFRAAHTDRRSSADPVFAEARA